VSIRRRLFARYYDRFQAGYDAYISERKRELFRDLHGTVLEIGPGTGANLAYVPPDVRWIGVEPNPHMHEHLRDKARAAGVTAEFRTASAQGMEADDGSVDAVVSTLVLCSVPDPRAVLSDIRRILRPGGTFRFIEHVAAPRGTWLRRGQGLVRPLWRFAADGCCPDRELGDLIRGAGFASVEMEEWRVPTTAILRIVSPHVAGIAVK